MKKTGKPLLDVIAGKKTKKTPVWLMRQAGRYLPEYREIRERAGSFLELCFNPELAAEVTLQPIRRFSLDAAIIFADILLVPHAMGLDLKFAEGEGPILENVGDIDDIARLSWNIGVLSPVFSAIEMVRKELPREVAMIGFAGSPWTVACYMTGGKGRDGFSRTVELANSPASLGDDSFLNRLLDAVHNSTLEYLGRQIEAGADVIQLFDSWAGLLHGAVYERFVVEPTQRLVEALKSEYPGIPVIGFPRGSGREEYQSYSRHTGVDVLGIDQDVELSFARDVLQKGRILQGNLSPEVLLAGGEKMKSAVDDIMTSLVRKNSPHVFNLGHGVLPGTPPDNVAELVRLVRGWSNGLSNG